MTSEIIEKVRTIAVELSARGTRPGFIAAGTQERAGEINRELMAWFNVEQDIVLHYRQVFEDKPNPYDTDDDKLYPQYVRVFRRICG